MKISSENIELKTRFTDNLTQKILRYDKTFKKCNHYVALYSKSNKLWHFNHTLKTEIG